MKGTTKKPTKPGYYWCDSIRLANPPEVVKVVLPGLVLSAGRAGLHGDFIDDCHWQGPISPEED